MSAGSPPFGIPPGGDPAGDSGVQEAWRALQVLAAGQYEVLGPLGRDANGELTFLARQRSDGVLVVLKRAAGSGPTSLRVIQQLDSSVPPPAGSCPVCQTPFRNWEPSCPDCGADVAGSAGDSLGPPEQVLAALRSAAPGYEVLGEMRRAVGGGRVFFAREPGGHLVALRLEEGADVRRSGEYRVSATRMMRPKLLYGTVGGDAARESGGAAGRSGWAPASSPSQSASPGTGVKMCPQCGDTFAADVRFCPRDGSTLRAAAPSADLVGQVIADRYHVLSQLGEGGMGQVYLAEHVRMGRRCALKVMNPALLHDPDSVSRFNREAENASRINHPNVAAIYDFGETPDQIVYLAMEFVEGESLAAMLQREHALTEQRTITLGRQIADALGAAHDLGIVHRDLKPDNIMVTRARGSQELVKVVDFGIAKATRGSRQTVTRTGYVIGTPAYMSPEQILGETLDGRSDIYSLGCILYEMLTGERAFSDPSGDVSIRQRLTEAAPRPRTINRHISKPLDEIVSRALARSPEQRYASAGDLRDGLAAAGAAPARRPGWRWWGSAAAADSEASAAPSLAATTAARSPSPPGATAPVPLGWAEAVQPPVRPLGRGTTILHRRSSRQTARRGMLIFGGGTAAVLIAVAAWWLLRPKPGGPARPAPAAVPAPAGAAQAPTPIASDTGAAPSTSAGSAGSGARDTVGSAGTLVGIRLTEALPLGARVALDGVETSPTPDGVLLTSPGRHTVSIRAPGYRAMSRIAVVPTGELVALRLPPVREGAPSSPQPGPAPAPATGSIVVTGNLPPGAAITLDGRSLPQGAHAAPASPGSHWLMVSAVGFRPDSGLVTVTAGGRAEWVAPALVPLPRPEPEPPAGGIAQRPPAAPVPAPAPHTPDSAGAAPRSVDHTGEVRQLLADYERAIDQRSLAGLKALYPTMPAQRERDWSDLFGDEVKDLKASVTMTGLDLAATPAEAYFDLVLSFKPDRGKPRNFKIRNRATLRQDPAGWRIVTLQERGD